MLWLALHLPLLSLEAFCAAAASRNGFRRDTSPVALTSSHRVTVANAAARSLGVRAGMKRATALALAPELLLGEAQSERDAAALEAVAHVALSFTPAVTLLEGTATVLMEVQASLRLFGGLRALRERLRADLEPMQHEVRMAAAPTALGAALLARWRHAGVGNEAFDPVLGPHATRLAALSPLLDRAPVWLLGPGREHWEALQGMGLRTLSDLRALPRAGLARRFGEALLEDLDRAHGLRPDPRRWLALPLRFETRLELHHRADNAEQVLSAADMLLERLVAWARARQGRVRAFMLVLHHEPRHLQGVEEVLDTSLRIELAEPTIETAHLRLLLRERLARLQLPAPTLELRLSCSDIVEGAAPDGELFPTRSTESIGLTRLLERLRARLGDGQVLRLEPRADHRPERSSGQHPALIGPPAAEGTPATPLGGGRHALPLHRPVWLLPQPQPLPERHAQPVLDGRPLQLLSGPERIEAGWWDGAPAARDYFIALAHDGSLVWIWRSRLPASQGETAQVQWMLHGRFA